MPKFTTKGTALLIDGKAVVAGWESWNGWYWFAVELTEVRTPGVGGGGSMIGGQEVPDRIYYGLVQGFEEEWGYFSEAELKSCGGKVWPIPARALPYAGRRT